MPLHRRAAGWAFTGSGVDRRGGAELASTLGGAGKPQLRQPDHLRRGGEVVPMTLWFALADGRLYATTPPDSGKMKRVRNDPQVILTPCNAWDRPRGESVEGWLGASTARHPDGAGRLA